MSKATGAALFAADEAVEGLWHGATVRSTSARARIHDVRWQVDRAPAGAVCVTARDLPGPNGIPFLDDSWPILASADVHHVGEAARDAVAHWGPDGSVVVSGTMQCPYYVHGALTHAFGLSDGQVRVRASVVGGGFGDKEDYPSLIAVHAALLARAAGAPVRITYDRHEDIVATTKRHPSAVRHRTAVDEDGRLRAMDIEVVLDGGAIPHALARGPVGRWAARDGSIPLPGRSHPWHRR